MTANIAVIVNTMYVYLYRCNFNNNTKKYLILLPFLSMISLPRSLSIIFFDCFSRNNSKIIPLTLANRFYQNSITWYFCLITWFLFIFLASSLPTITFPSIFSIFIMLFKFSFWIKWHVTLFTFIRRSTRWHHFSFTSYQLIYSLH